MDSGTSSGRSRRALSQSMVKKKEALEKLRSLNRAGIKNKYDSIKEEMIYDEVDEVSYANLVSKRQREDWIVDDDGSGYAEHGREIFDDDDDNDSDAEINLNKLKKEKYKLPKIDLNEDNKKTDIRQMFISLNKKSSSSTKPWSVGKNSTNKSLNDVKIDDSNIESIVDLAFNEEDVNLKLPSDYSTPQPLKLKKKFTSSSSSIKRKCLEASDKIQKKILNLKRKNNLFSDVDSFNFNDIDSSSKTEDDSGMSLINEQPMEMCYSNDNDDSNNNNGDDEVISNLPQATTFDNKDNWNKMEEKLSEEKWIVSNEENFGELTTNSKIILPKEITFEKDDENNNLIKFYWIDAFHDSNNPNCSQLVFLFGKIYLDHIKSFASCCLKVENVDRRVFILPRKYFLNDPTRLVEIEDVFKEFEQQVAPQIKIKQFRSRKVTKKYCFDYVDNVPNEAEYLEIVYSAKYSVIPEKFLKGNSYRHIFGVNSSILENLILDLNLMGPGWLLLNNPDISDVSISWCKVELTITKPLKQVSVLPEPFPPVPPLTILSLCFKTFVQPETRTTNIVAISCLVNRKFFFDNAFNKDSIDKFDQHFCIITTIGGKNSPQLPFDFNKKMALKDYQKTRIDVMNSERELLMFFTAKFQQIDPDIIVGHDVFNFDYDILLQRFAQYKISLHWSKLGRLKCSRLPNRNKDKHLLTGRLICDIKIISRELVRATSYDLTELSAQILKKGRFEIEPNLLGNYYETSAKLIRFVEFLMKDNDLILSIAFELNCLQLFKQITNIAGNLLSRNLLGGRSDVNEYLLLHAFYSGGYIVPDKLTKTHYYKQDFEKEQSNEQTNIDARKKLSSYTGGLVLHPKIGFYDRFILLMDFNSLYPSIIQEYNICFTTIPASYSIENECNNESKTLRFIEGILPIEIRKLVDSRRQVKRLLCDSTLSSDQRDQLDIKQKALKITANSIYGCLGFTRSRFYAKHLASLVTKKGREILQNTKELVENMGFDVIYGDTDSIMILTNCLKYEEVREIGYKIQAEVNRHYKLLEIDIDAIFRCMLLLKKKKYAALSVCRAPNQSLQFQREIKGLDIIRRDWSVLAKVAGEAILDQILKPDQTSEVIVNNIHEYLKQLAHKIRSNEFDLEQFIINKALTKKPEEYNEGAKTLTHVMIALRYNLSNLGKKLSAGDTVPFVICLDGTRNSATQRGYHIDEYRHQKMLQLDLRIDNDYYLSQQLLPVVSRLCDPIDGTDAGIIAEFLGIEGIVKRSNNISRSIKTNQDLTSYNNTFAGDEHRFDNCQPFKFHCPYEGCGKEVELRHLFSIWNKNFILNNVNYKQYSDDELFNMSISKCLHCQRTFPKLDFYLDLVLSQQINQAINTFYQHLVICDDNVCSYRTNYQSGLTNGKHLICPKCGNGNLQPVRSEHFLYQQLTFFHHLFDLEGSLARFNGLPVANNEHRARKNEIRQMYGELCQRLQRTVQNFLDHSSYNEIDLGFLFRKFRYNNNSQ